MRILFQARQEILSSRGGDAIQLKATREHLIQRGIEVDFNPSPACDCSRYDIVHLFNMTRPYETSLQLANAKKQDKPVCLSTIYWNMDDLRRGIVSTPPSWLLAARKIRILIRWAGNLFNEQMRHTYREGQLMASLTAVKACQRELINGADMLLPNSKTELALLHRDFPASQNKLHSVVHNCIDVEVFNNSSEALRNWGSARGIAKFIICAGRLEPRKNQVNLLRAMSKTDIPVVLVGSKGTSRPYIAEIHRAMKSQDIIVNEVNQKELSLIYAAARIHVLASFYETPGLSSLEAGAMGCNLVMSEIGSQREYFGERVEYCDPYSIDSIRLAVERAWARPWPNLKLASFIQSNYNWKVAAQETHEAYKLLLRAK